MPEKNVYLTLVQESQERPFPTYLYNKSAADDFEYTFAEIGKIYVNERIIIEKRQ